MITLLIIAITVFISITTMENHTLKNKMMFNAYMINHRKEWWRFFSSGLIHADWMHLGFNMFSFYMFGRAVEDSFAYLFDGKGTFFYLILYVGGIATKRTNKIFITMHWVHRAQYRQLFLLTSLLHRLLN